MCQFFAVSPIGLKRKSFCRTEYVVNSGSAPQPSANELVRINVTANCCCWCFKERLLVCCIKVAKNQDLSKKKIDVVVNRKCTELFTEPIDQNAYQTHKRGKGGRDIHRLFISAMVNKCLIMSRWIVYLFQDFGKRLCRMCSWRNFQNRYRWCLL